MALFQNEKLFEIIENQISDANEKMKDLLIREPFTENFSRRFCWSSNAIEGNTLSLDETVDFLDYDEVRSGHSYSEYQDTKALYRAICTMLEAVYYPPSYEKVPECMAEFMKCLSMSGKDMAESLSTIAKNHME